MSRYNGMIRPVWAEIDLAAVRHNLGEVRRLIGPAVGLMAVVKAEAYGHGALPVAQTALQAGAGWLGVSLPEEGIALREGGITAPILVFCPLQTDQVQAVLEYDLTATVCLLESAAALAEAAHSLGRSAPVHVKIDTGMGRVGVLDQEALRFITALSGLAGIRVEGVYSHLATADLKAKDFARQQVERFQLVLDELSRAGLRPPLVHLANSAAIIDLPETYFNLVRPGIMLYGLYPSAEVNQERVALQPALELKARVVFAKQVPPGTGISYGQHYHTAATANIATIPIGYADGWSRRLSGQARALIAGRSYPIVGTICMDQCLIDLGADPVSLGAEVVLIGRQGAARITADQIAAQLGTINYEVTCMLSDRVPRIYRNQEPGKD